MSKRTFEETVERSLTRLLRSKPRSRDGKPAAPELTPDQKIKALAVAVRFAAVKKGIDGAAGSAFDEDD